jgi:hypothetical protein
MNRKRIRGLFPRVARQENVNVDVRKGCGWMLDKRDGETQTSERDGKGATLEDEAVPIYADETVFAANLIANVIAECGYREGLKRHR